MGTYSNKRKKTKEKIELAFWEDYVNSGYRRVTVKQICEKTNIHRSTFYAYFSSVGSVFDAIKKTQLENLKSVLQIHDSFENEFKTRLNALQSMYKKNEKFLKPLLVEQHSASFVKEYRNMVIDDLIEQTGLSAGKRDSEQYYTVRIIVGCFADAMFRTLANEKMDLLAAWHTANFILNEGVRPVLSTRFE